MHFIKIFGYSNTVQDNQTIGVLKDFIRHALVNYLGRGNLVFAHHITKDIMIEAVYSYCELGCHVSNNSHYLCVITKNPTMESDIVKAIMAGDVMIDRKTPLIVKLFGEVIN
ncbi:MAG: hypothetical protein NTW06_04195 [Candidatus Falkowbacteria bacterium]|nr:hypothetical protein [Candidatus Falkowbacteria bacterium]